MIEIMFFSRDILGVVSGDDELLMLTIFTTCYLLICSNILLYYIGYG